MDVQGQSSGVVATWRAFAGTCDLEAPGRADGLVVTSLAAELVSPTSAFWGVLPELGCSGL